MRSIMSSNEAVLVPATTSQMVDSWGAVGCANWSPIASATQNAEFVVPNYMVQYNKEPV